MKKVLVLAGGNSAEREVSLRSGQVVEASLQQANYAVSFLDPVNPLETYLNEFKETDVVFPALHGRGGEDGELQEFLEKTGATFVGSGSASSHLCFNKVRYLDLIVSNGILSPETEVVNRKKFDSSDLVRAPFVLKPIDEGSSIDTIVLKDLAKLDLSLIDKVFDNHAEMILEPFIAGHEITVSVLGEQALPVIEIVPPEDEDFNYENKYNGKTLEICPPKSVSLEIQVSAKKLAERIHALCGCSDMSRTDMIVGYDNSIYVLETNTIPGLTERSLLPKSALAYGLNMSDLCAQLVEMALSRFK